MVRREVSHREVLSRFVGQAAELRQLHGLLNGHALVTLLGAGGIGKTRLAREVLTERAGTFVDLTTATTIDGATGLIVQTLGWTHPAKPPQQILLDRLPSLEGLLVLDNLEQVLEIREQVREWLERAPNVRILTTSREALGIPGEFTFDVRPLRLPDTDVRTEQALARSEAGALLVSAVRRVNPLLEFTPDEVRAAARLCGRLDGLPLAIELVASRMDLFSPRAALGLLEAGHVLPGGRGREARHASVEAAVRWSADLLSDEERRVFRLQGVFSGSFDVQAVAAVAGVTDDAALLTLRQLVRKSLVRELRGGHAPRFVLLETVRLVALRLLHSAQEEHGARVRHARHYAGVTGRLARERANVPGVPELFRPELPQVRAAMEWLTDSPGPDAELDTVCCVLAENLAVLLHDFDASREARSWLERTLSRVGLPDESRASLTLKLARVLLNMGEYRAGLDITRQLLAVSAGGQHGLACEAFHVKHLLLYYLGQHDVSVREIDAELEYTRAHGRLMDYCNLLAAGARCRLASGDREGALSMAAEADEHCASRPADFAGVPDAERESLSFLLGITYSEARSYERALSAGQQSHELSVRLGHHKRATQVLQLLAFTYYTMDRLPEALDAAQRAWATREAFGNEPGMARAVLHLVHARILLADGQFEACRAHLAEAREQPLGSFGGVMRALVDLEGHLLEETTRGAGAAFARLFESGFIERLRDVSPTEIADEASHLLLFAARAASPGLLAAEALGAFRTQIRSPPIPLSAREARAVQEVLRPLLERHSPEAVQAHLEAGAERDPHELALQVGRELQRRGGGTEGRAPPG